MKKTVKRLFSLIMLTVLMISATVTGFAATEGKVTFSYDNGRQSFTVEPGTVYSATDLFPNFKNLMPGDTAEQNISVTYDGKSGYIARIYVKPTGVAQDFPNASQGESLNDKTRNDNILDYITLDVSVRNDSRKLFDIDNQKNGMDEWVHIGNLQKGGTVELYAELTLDIMADSKIRNSATALEWQFKVEEIKIEENKGDIPMIPDTGDHSDIMLYGCLAAVSGFALVVLLAKRKKEEN